jgi:hypothetical protein
MWDQIAPVASLELAQSRTANCVQDTLRRHRRMSITIRRAAGVRTLEWNWTAPGKQRGYTHDAALKKAAKETWRASLEPERLTEGEHRITGKTAEECYAKLISNLTETHQFLARSSPR